MPAPKARSSALFSCSRTSHPFCLSAMAAVSPAKPPPATSARRVLPDVVFTLAMFGSCCIQVMTLGDGRHVARKGVQPSGVYEVRDRFQGDLRRDLVDVMVGARDDDDRQIGTQPACLRQRRRRNKL